MEIIITSLIISGVANIVLLVLAVKKQNPFNEYSHALELRLLDSENENNKNKTYIKHLHSFLCVQCKTKLRNPPPAPEPPPGRELGKPIKPNWQPKSKLEFKRSNVLGESEFVFVENKYECKSMRELIYEIDWYNLKIHDTNGGECNPVVENMIGELFKIMNRYAYQETAQTMKQVLNKQLTPMEIIDSCTKAIKDIDMQISETNKFSISQ